MGIGRFGESSTVEEDDTLEQDSREQSKKSLHADAPNWRVSATYPPILH